jgi:beta-galactosidase
VIPRFSGELHYARIPPEYWPARLAMAAGMGCDAISTYVFWNLHEPQPQQYDFSAGNDVAAFVRLAAGAGLRVVLRPGPYVCAEWDFGGLPAWLLRDGPIPLRSTDPRYLEPARRWLRRLGEELAPLQCAFGGPIAAVQLENEYGAFGDDREYLRELRDAYDDAGFSASPYFTIDQPADLARGCLDGVAAAVTFGPGRLEEAQRALDALRPGQPKHCGEYWAGWYQRWGEQPEPDDLEQQVRDLRRMLAEEWCVNVYMLHGGTNFGFTGGANAAPDGSAYGPVTTSYDYRAAIDEAGRATRKYVAFRDLRAKRRTAAPSSPRTIAIPPFPLDESAAMEAALSSAVRSQRPQTFEMLGHPFGYVLYGATLNEGGDGTLELPAIHDYAAVLLDGIPAAHADRRFPQTQVELSGVQRGSRLEVLVENCGRVNYGAAQPLDVKGLTAPVRWRGRDVEQWDHRCLRLHDLGPLQFGNARPCGPAFLRGSFACDEPADTFLDAGALFKGTLFVNGHNAGRYWNVGPQRRLFVPAAWLRRGRNEVVAFDLKPATGVTLRGCTEPRDGAA